MRWPAIAAGWLVAALVRCDARRVGALALGVTAALAAVWALYLRRRLGGFTGDTLGALVEVSEAGLLTLAVSLDFVELL